VTPPVEEFPRDGVTTPAVAPPAVPPTKSAVPEAFPTGD
jgi:hypothetical protein